PQDAGSSSEPFGNIAFGEGCMIVATPTELWGYIPERMRLNFRRKEVEQRPNDALAHYHLGLALADAGREGEAVASFQLAAEKASAEDYHCKHSLKELALRREHESMLGWAILASKQKLPDLNWFIRCMDDRFALKDRVRAQIILIQGWPAQYVIFRRMASG